MKHVPVDSGYLTGAQAATRCAPWAWFIAVLVTASLALGGSAPAMADPVEPGFTVPVPAAPLAGPPVTLTRQAVQARYLESLTKARFHAKMAEAASRMTPNMAQYDVVHYDLDLALNPTTQILVGTVVVTARVVGESIIKLDLDLSTALTVSSGTSGGLPASVTRDGAVISITLDRAYAPGELVRAGVTYSGNPSGSAFGWSTYSGQPLIWTLSEPYGASTWWPCKNVNTDKADSLDLRVTVPDGLIVGSNGTLISEIDNGPTRTFHWRERYPIATYLVSLAIHPYVVFSHWYTPLAGGDPMEVRYYVVSNRVAEAQAGYAPTVAMITAFAQGFGEYPFVMEKYGHAHFPWGGGMEHQTLTSLSYNGYAPWLIAHELSHQWWGDMITCADFHHIWLNEGFATWSEAYWREVSEGMAAYHEEMNGATYLGPGTIYVEDPTNFNDIFNFNLSYQKASWVVHMLRYVLGDVDFFASLQAYRAGREYGTATTEEFRDICEGVSGQDLDAFFQQWIYGEYFPVYEYSYYFLAQGDSTRVNVRVRQTQTGAGLFEMPLDIGVQTGAGWVDFTVQNNAWDQAYTFKVGGTALAVAVDRERWILQQNSGTQTDVAFAPLPVRPVLGANYPNPFNPETSVPFSLPQSGRTRLAVYDVAGRLVRILVDGVLPAGGHHARWDGLDDTGRAVASGVYVIRLSAGGQHESRAAVLAR